VLIRGLPFQDSGNLYVLGTTPLQPQAPGQVNPVSSDQLQTWRGQAQQFVGRAAFAQQSVTVADDRAMPHRASGARGSDTLFPLPGQPSVLGRDFTTADGEGGAEQVVVLGHSLWQNRYGGDPNVLGTGIRINGEPAVIVGVMPPGIKFPTRADLWMQI